MDNTIKNIQDLKYLLIEPFYGGSHKQLIDCLIKGIFSENNYELITLSAKKWHWRARTSALYLSQIIPFQEYRILFASSVLNLAELIALRPDLYKTKKIIYFHENQLIYPKQEEKERDFQYGYNQILTCLVADVVVFNSLYNQNSFLNSINKFLKKQPDYRCKNLNNKILPKCQVLYFPLEFPSFSPSAKEHSQLHLVWPHRWEYDKDPEMLFRVLFKLNNMKVNFKISILGESFTDNPKIFEEAKEVLKEHVEFWGYMKTKEEYYKVLHDADIVISTAKHEFYGVSMLEATYLGCFPLCPNDLVYPEIYPEMSLFKNENDLFKKLANLCNNPNILKTLLIKFKIDFNKFDSKKLIPEYKKLFDI